MPAASPGQPQPIAGFHQDEHGDWYDYEGEELLARAFQHEIDHLDGVLMIDRIPRQRRKEAMRALRELVATSPTTGSPPPGDEAGRAERDRAGNEAGEPERDPTPA